MRREGPADLRQSAEQLRQACPKEEQWRHGILNSAEINNVPGTVQRQEAVRAADYLPQGDVVDLVPARRKSDDVAGVVRPPQDQAPPEHRQLRDRGHPLPPDWGCVDYVPKLRGQTLKWPAQSRRPGSHPGHPQDLYSLDRTIADLEALGRPGSSIR